MNERHSPPSAHGGFLGPLMGFATRVPVTGRIYVAAVALACCLTALMAIAKTAHDIPQSGKNPAKALFFTTPGAAPENAVEIAKVIGADHAEAAKCALVLDWFFLIPFYFLFLLAGETLLPEASENASTFWRHRKVWVWRLAFICLVADIIENALLYSLVSGNTSAGWAYGTWAFVQIKFLAFFLAYALFLLEACRLLSSQKYLWILILVFYMRVPIIAAFALCLLGILGIAGPSEVNIVMRVDGFFHLILVFAAVFMAMGVTAYCGAVVWRLARLRFDIEKAPDPQENVRFFEQWPFMAAGVPLVAALIFAQRGDWAWVFAAIAAFFGFVVCSVMVWVIRWCFRRIFPTRPKFLYKLAKSLGRGFVSEIEDNVRQEHVFAATSLAGLLVVYIAEYFIFHPSNGFNISILLSVLTFFAMLVSILTGVAFYFDRYRVPVLFVVIVYIVVWHWGLKVDHTFPVKYIETTAPATPSAAAAKRMAANPTETAIVVCASGGGIQAAAWTARVLTGLEDRYPEFSCQVFLLSATSGGAVGSMYYLESFDSQSGAVKADPVREAWFQDNPGVAREDPNAPRHAVVEAAMASGIEAVGWGFAYPDFVRAVIPPIVRFNRNIDRGWALERVFEEQTKRLHERLGLADGPHTYSEWAKDVAGGKLPGLVLNATVIETGKQLAIATLDFPPHSVDEASPATTMLHDRTFYAVYRAPASTPQVFPDIVSVTAARLSATFPYVSPIARAEGSYGDFDAPTWHLADGGYFDNHGHMAALEWCRYVLQQKEGEAPPTVKKLVILQVNAFPVGQEQDHGAGGANGWMFASLGPALGLARVRTSSQLARGNLEFETLKLAFPHRVETMEIRPDELEHGNVVSWHLGENNKHDIDAAWQRFIKAKGDILDDVLNRQSTNP